MERAITGFHADDHGDWVAELACLHGQHVRHQPPFREAPWVHEELGRRDRIGASLDCPLCDRAELPEGLRVVRTTPTWDDGNMPAGLRQTHRVAEGVWGRLVVESGALHFEAETHPRIDRVISQGQSQALPPDVDHHIEPVGAVRFHLEFLQ